MRPVTVNVKKLRELHAAGLSDRKIAAALGCHVRTVTLHRYKLALPSNHRSYTQREKPASCNEHMPERLRPRLRLLLLGMSRYPGKKVWLNAWQYFRWLEGKPSETKLC